MTRVQVIASVFGIELPGVLFVSVLGIIFTWLLCATRWVRRRRASARAENWTRVDAAVTSSYELDENDRVDSPNIINTYLEGDKAEYVACWVSAIQYTYHVNGEIYAGTYFLPQTSPDGHLAAEAGRRWVGRKIVVRVNPDSPEESFFLEQDGAPGKPHILRSISDSPYMTTLSLGDVAKNSSTD